MNDEAIFDYLDGTADVQAFGGFESPTIVMDDAVVLVSREVDLSSDVDVTQAQRTAVLRVIDGRLYSLSTDSPPSVRQQS